jgi:hypothetical protein
MHARLTPRDSATTRVLARPGEERPFHRRRQPQQARAFAASLTAPGSALSLDELTADILHTDGAARADLSASLREGRFADELAIAAAAGDPARLGRAAGYLGYLQQLTIPSLCRGGVQLIAGAGHAPHQETPGTFTELLTSPYRYLGDQRYAL